VTICGINLSKDACESLNQGLLTTKLLSSLKLNFCLTKRECLLALMPALCSPDRVPLGELSLAANGFSDDDYSDLISKIVISH
jgi:hypothetical protein